MKKMKWMPFILLSITTSSHANSGIKTGFFIDSPVTGLYYETSSNLSGVTSKGAFDYRSGDVVRFFLGKDNSGYLISTLSAQEVVTPTLASTTPSKSINLTRLLLSLDSTPNNRDEITLASRALSDTDFQQQLKQIDLSTLDQSAQQLDLDLVSIKDAVHHLNQSQSYIEKNFTSNEVIYRPLNKRLVSVYIQKQDWRGRRCYYDLKYKDHPKYSPPLGRIEYSIGTEYLTQYPSIGDYFNGCQLIKEKALSHDQIPIQKALGWGGLIACSVSGCTRSDLNGFSVENRQDEDSWKYRSVAMNFDPETQLYMSKTQGLGKSEHIQYLNKGESFGFVYEKTKGSTIAFEGVWQQTQYEGEKITQSCLLIENKRILTTQSKKEICSTNKTSYTNDVTERYGDMWWVQNPEPYAELEQMNLLVRWHEKGKKPQYTSWEYLPAGATWDKGLLYRYQQEKYRYPNGSEEMNTFRISEFRKITGRT
ncbi:chromosome partitioning protein ParA [Aliivibrio sp. S2TY2]|nr:MULTISPECIES: chromosome partitioning protein ParA [Aliivibrio]MDD9176646.1 chromosome partitioning protein ParA [Aliivibrio sp. S3TY1]MDD9193724.1 chromosome partitioning protein ParA [Aliivibrio sp. S2TY2]